MLIENLVNGWFKVWVVAVLLFGTVACDSSDGEGNLSLAAPAIGQSEERSTEPVLLAFGWSAVEDAAEYAYRLDEVVGEELHPLLSGKTAATSVELGGERGRTLSLGTTYRFSVQALPAEGVTLSASAFASVDITTSEAPIALTVENLTYRSARLRVEPKDGALLYQFAQIPVEKYLAYDSDMAFIEGYDFGYYKAMTAAMPWVKWYQWMEEASKTGNSVYDTRILNPGVDYMLYAYGVEFDSSNEEEPVRVTTPLYIKNFTTPEWKATSNCTFDVEVTGQELVEVTDSETGEPFNTVNVTVEVTPSDDTEHYYVAFPQSDVVADNGGDYGYAFALVLSMEQYEGISSWFAPGILSEGKATVSAIDHGFSVLPGTKCSVLVFGVSELGLVTTAIQRLDIDAVSKGSAAGSSSGVKLGRGAFAGHPAVRQRL